MWHVRVGSSNSARTWVSHKTAYQQVQSGQRPPRASICLSQELFAECDAVYDALSKLLSEEMESDDDAGVDKDQKADDHDDDELMNENKSGEAPEPMTITSESPPQPAAPAVATSATMAAATATPATATTATATSAELPLPSTTSTSVDMEIDLAQQPNMSTAPVKDINTPFLVTFDPLKHRRSEEDLTGTVLDAFRVLAPNRDCRTALKIAGAKREAYHGGDLNGNSARRVMEESDKFFDEVQKALLVSGTPTATSALMTSRKPCKTTAVSSPH